ncbi:zinc finger CCCH domain-containing protein 11A-like [Anomaloglossus baeobatrachus]|uniref:zinc finger CCCH domain-containing protein 11A-like n=1 Tax=Anomaloglossus baeobatrachus TaxID=238106 RepID=UPI003F50A703
MSKQGDDCYYFYYSTCTKGDGCAFRHCEAALGNETVCALWKEGRCFRQICKFRHMEIDKKCSEIACYWENQISGCQKANCAFHHTKGRFVDGAFFPPSKAVGTPQPCEPDVPTSLPSPTPAKLSVAPTPQLRGVKKLEATENVPSPTHPPVVINAADDDEDDDDQFSEEGDEMKNSSQHSMSSVNQKGIHLSTRKSMKKDSTASSEMFISSSNQKEHSGSFQLTVKFSHKDIPANLSLAQRLGKRKKFQEDSPLAASEGEVLPPVKKSLSERLGKRVAAPTDSPDFQPKKVPSSRHLKDRLGLPAKQENREAETIVNTGANFHIKTLQEIRQEKSNQRLEQEVSSSSSQNEEKIDVKTQPSSNPQAGIYIKSLREIQAEKRLRQLKDVVEKCETAKDENDGKADKDLEEKPDGRTAQHRIVPSENTQKQAGFNWRRQGKRNIKRDIVTDNNSTNVSTTKPLSVSVNGPKCRMQSIEKVRVKTLEEIRQEKALRLQQTPKSENVESTSPPQAPSHHRKILRISKLPGRTDAKLYPSTDKPTPAEETSVTIRSSVKMSSPKEELKKNIAAKMESSVLSADSPVSPLKRGRDTEVFKPAQLTADKREKPKLNIEPCVVKKILPVKVTAKQKAQERAIVAELKPMSSAVTLSGDDEATEILSITESSDEPSTDSPKSKRLKLSPQDYSSLPSVSAPVPLPIKSPRTSTASVGKPSVSAEDEFEDLMWEMDDDKLDGDLDLDSNKDEDALLLELSKMIDS